MTWWRDRPLRTQLVVIVVAVAALGLLVTGFVSVAALRGYLLNQIDEQLVQFASAGGGPGPFEGPEPHERGEPRFPSDYYVQYSDGSAVQVLSDPLGSAEPEIAPMSATEAQAIGTAPYTVPGSGDSSWRAASRPYAGGSITIARSLAEVEGTVRRLAMLELVVGLLILGVLVLVATLAVRRSLRPLSDVERTATAIAAGDLSRRVPAAPPSTEVGRLSSAFNRMLDHISLTIGQRDTALAESRASEERMRQFVADASHELRTPLTSIRGFAELYRQGGIASPEVPATFARMEGESQRMGALVDDLLLLARLDQQRPLDRSPVDLWELSRDVVESARAAHPERTVTLTVAGGEAPIVTGDALRLRQVVANLVANALAYSSADVAVSVQSADRVAVSVADHGPGIPDADKGRVFERFFRGDSSRTRAAGGTGLGLSIVSAIVQAHGGTVSLADNAGGGAVFTVSLPR